MGMNIHCRAAALSLPVAGAVPVGTAAGQPPERPNIVILYADDMGVGDVAAANVASKIPTPHLDRLAREGTRCTDAHSVSGICTPSRYALLHGRYHWRKFHGIVNSFDQPVMDPDRTTLPEMLRAKGYAIRHGDWVLIDATISRRSKTATPTLPPARSN